MYLTCNMKHVIIRMSLIYRILNCMSFVCLIVNIQGLLISHEPDQEGNKLQ